MLKKFVTVLLIAAFVFALLLMPERFSVAVSGGLRLCLQSVVPALFLFLCTAELIRSLRLFGRFTRRFGRLLRPLHLPPTVMPCLILGAVCGFPIGAKEICAARQEKSLTERQAAYALSLCSGASPAFLAAFVGARLFGKPALGILIWGISLLSSLLVNGALCRKALQGQPTTGRFSAMTEMPPLFPALLSSIKNAGRTLASICSLILFFSSVCSVLAGLFPMLNSNLSAFLFGLIEMTGGIAFLSSPSPLSASLCAGLTTFGGLSITAQTLLFAKQARLSIRPYLLGRTLSALLSATLSFVVFFSISGTY